MDDRIDYGEERFVTLGILEERVVTADSPIHLQIAVRRKRGGLMVFIWKSRRIKRNG